MAKLSGFCMSALLVVLCLRINVYCYPDAFHLVAPPADSSVQTQTDGAEENASDDELKNESVSSSPESKANDSERSDDATDGTKEENNDPKNDSGVSETTDEATIVAQKKPLTDANGSRKLSVDVGTDVRAEPGATLEHASMTREVSDEAPDAVPSQGGVPARLEKDAQTDGAPSDAVHPNVDEKTAKPTQTSASSKPQGGKYVSIPSFKTDALAPSASDGDCRVVGATRAVRMRIVPNSQK